jgi:hypothetical protein
VHLCLHVASKKLHSSEITHGRRVVTGKQLDEFGARSKTYRRKWLAGLCFVLFCVERFYTPCNRRKNEAYVKHTLDEFVLKLALSITLSWSMY